MRTFTAGQATCGQGEGAKTGIFCGRLLWTTPRTENFSSVRRSPTMRPQQDFSRTFCSCCCPQLLSCSFLVPLGLLSHYLSTSLVVFLCFLFPPLVHVMRNHICRLCRTCETFVGILVPTEGLNGI